MTTLAASKALHRASVLDRRDRRLLLLCIGIVVVLAFVVTILAPQEDDDDPVPSSFSSASRGAEAAYLALQRSGYRIERWQKPLDTLAVESDAHTVLVLAEPFRFDIAGAAGPVEKILRKGGRVIVTGATGAWLLPNGRAEESPIQVDRPCDAKPDASVAGLGKIEMRPLAHWTATQANQQIEYTCEGGPVVVSYLVGPGHAIWWANSMPLENAEVAKDGDLGLLLHSIGSDVDARIVWDESLHQERRSLWSYAQGTPVALLWVQLALVAGLLIFSFSRRSGPLLPDPVTSRDTQLEFVHSLGALYDRAGATNTAVKIAYDRLRLLLGRRALRSDKAGGADRTEEMIGLLNSRVGHPFAGLRERISECEELTYATEPMPAREALSVVQSLRDLEEEIRQGGTNKRKEDDAGE